MLMSCPGYEQLCDTCWPVSLTSLPLTLIPWKSVSFLCSSWMIHSCPVWEENRSVPLFPRTFYRTVVLLLGLQQTVPAANLLSFRLFHLSPVGELLLSRAIEAKRNPANHLLTLHAALVVNGEDERDVRQLEKCYLEDKRLFVGWVGLAPADGCLALGHLMTHGVQQGQLHICICARNRWGGSEGKGRQPSASQCCSMPDVFKEIRHLTRHHLCKILMFPQSLSLSSSVTSCRNAWCRVWCIVPTMHHLFQSCHRRWHKRSWPHRLLFSSNHKALLFLIAERVKSQRVLLLCNYCMSNLKQVIRWKIKMDGRT